MKDQMKRNGHDLSGAVHIKIMTSTAQQKIYTMRSFLDHLLNSICSPLELKVIQGGGLIVLIDNWQQAKSAVHELKLI